jgi:uncharacterized small protein (DUF1192 family)
MTDQPDAGVAAATAALAETVGTLSVEVAALRNEVKRLDADLDESRRLNLRAAELLDAVYENLGRFTPEP